MNELLLLCFEVNGFRFNLILFIYPLQSESAVFLINLFALRSCSTFSFNLYYIHNDNINNIKFNSNIIIIYHYVSITNIKAIFHLILIIVVH